MKNNAVAKRKKRQDDILEEFCNVGDEAIQVQNSVKEIEYSVEYMSLPPKALQYMNRKDEDAYINACGKKFILPLFPLQMDTKNRNPHKEYRRLSRIVTSVRVRRLVLMQSIKDLSNDIKKYYDLEYICLKKMEKHEKRLEVLEGEMDSLAQNDSVTMPSSRFSALLASSTGWSMVITYMHKECRRVQQAYHFGMEAHTLKLEEIKCAWQLIQIWQLLKYVELRCRIGMVGYLRESGESNDKDNDKEKKKNKQIGWDDNDHGENEDKQKAEKALPQEEIDDPTAALVAPAENVVAVNLLELALSNAEDELEEHFLHPLFPHDLGGKSASWAMVQKYLDSTDNSLLAVLTAIRKMATEDPRMKDIVQKITVNHLSTQIHDLSGESVGKIGIDISRIKDADLFAAGALTHVMDDLGTAIEKILLNALRLNPYWPKMLELIRKERIRKSGGKQVFHGDGEVEVDAHGVSKTIPNADDIIDTDIFHGSMQRMRIQVVLPELSTKRIANKEQESAVNGELACLIQFGYETAVLALQRVGRRWIVRLRRYYLLREITWMSFNIAAARIQAWTRKNLTKRRFAETLADQAVVARMYNVIVIQKNIRRFVKYKWYSKIAIESHHRRIHRTVSLFQAIIRGFIVRRNQKKRLTGMKDILLHEEADWAATTIQKVVRRRLVQKTILKSLTVRKSISKDLLKLAEKYLGHGDLWSFLKDVDERMKRLNDTIGENQGREDAMADTFVNKVLFQRKQEFDGAWDKFSRTITSHGIRRSSETMHDEGKPSLPPDILSAITTRNKTMGKTKKGSKQLKPLKKMATTSGSSSTIPAHTMTGFGSMETMLQGPLLRRAVTATVRDAVENELDARQQNVSRSVKLIDEINMAYCNDVGREDSGSISISQVSAPGLKSIKQKKKASLFDTGLVAGEASAKPSKISAQHEDWVTSTTKTVSSSNIAPGESLLMDIPLGMDDTAEKLIRAGAIRSYVPEFFPDHTSKAAYEMYLKLPVGLSKIRYEQEAWRWCQVAVNGLKMKGLVFIKDLLPISKFTMLLKGVQTPENVINTCKDIVHALMKMGNAPKGFSHKRSVRQIESRKGVDIMDLDEVEDYQDDKSTTSSRSPNHKSQDKQVVVDGEINEGLWQENTSIGISQDPKLPGRILEMNTETGDWAKLKSTVEEFLLHGAFLVCPNIAKESISDFEDPLTVRDMGHAAFKAYIRTLQRAHDEKSRREITRSRFRAALILATPFSLRLQANGVYTVQDLIPVNLRSMNMPPILQAQIEALLTVAIGQSVKAKAQKTTKNYEKNDKNEFDVPMLYDPKFQRGPLDPYGRPPRIGGLAKLFRKKSKLVQTEHIDDIDDEFLDLPEGIWESSHHASTNDINKLWKFNSIESRAKDDAFDETQDTGLIAFSMGGTGTTDHATKRLPGVTTVTPNKSSIEMNSFLSLPDGNTTLSSSQKVMEHKGKKDNTKWSPKPDFEAHVVGGFARPYICTYRGCGQAFSRQYTLNVHVKSHEFTRYYAYKKEPALFFDPHLDCMKEAVANYAEGKGNLPPLVVDELKAIRAMFSSFPERIRSLP